ncbi:MAG TPA: GxxExxY protein [Burkholderiales bacterium]|jgi:GxxExxY protein|nr:GxxExxY protein [Burkholderiales bacterium]
MDNELSGEIIGAAIEVHRILGPGLLESLYEEALILELQQRKVKVFRQVEVPVEYKGYRLANQLRLDLLVDDLIVVEVKSVERILPVHEAQLLGYLRLTGKRLGLLINFNSAVLSRAVRRIINQF